ncbi:MAG: polysaccharide biosynthesis tyrosine autokinase [Thermodesulfobacteriota bacterium]|nr:polysaccharide biosynthesis tyrosine autokinase [Thermodesulfobacteriota bacterium]
MELARIWEVIRRRRWVILQALMVVTLVVVTGSYLMTPSYEASSKILMMKAKKGDIGLGNIGLSSLSPMLTTSSDVDVNKVLAASRPYMEKMIFRLQLRDEEGRLIHGDKLTQTGAISSIKGKLSPMPRISISQYQGTDVLQIKGASRHPQEAMMMANTLAEIMVEQNQSQVRAEYRNARVFLEDQMNKVKDRYNAALKRMADFKKQEQTLDLEIETKLAAEKMTELMKEKEDNIIDLDEARASLSRLKEQLATQSPEFLSASTLKENPHIEVLKKRLTELGLQLTQARSNLTERHPQVLSLREQIKVAEAELEKEIDIYRSSAPALTELQRKIASLEAHLKGVNADIDKYFTAFGELPGKVYKQAGLDMELNVTHQSYSALLDSLYQIGMAEAATLSEIRVVEPAVRPLFPVSPNKTLNGVLGLFLGLIFGIGLAFTMEYLDDTVRTADDIKEFRPIVLMGTVPKFKPKTLSLISAKDANDPLFESYRSIRNYPIMNGTPSRSLLITSAGPEEGKSTTVLNLGISFARQGKKVVIVDMDLRRPNLHAYLNLPNKVGITDLLQGKASVDKAIQTTQVEGLSMIPGGPPFDDPAALIDSGKMGQLMPDLKSRFEVVIIDSAPLFVKSDALVMAKYVDASIIVLASEKTTRRAVSELIDVMTKAHIKPLGFILNRCSVEKGKHLYHQYYCGHYGSELSTSTRRS